MTVTPDSLKSWCSNILSGDAESPQRSLQAYLDAIPQLDSLADLPEGTPVLVRGDVDAKVGDQVGKGDIRLRSMEDTLRFGIERGWKQIIFGHIGREPEGSLDKVARRLGELLGCSVPLVDNWMDDATGRISDDLARTIKSAKPGTMFVLQNARKYKLETVLWKKKKADLEKMTGDLTRLATYCNDLAEKVASVYVHEALSAGSLDSSSVVAPAGMRKVAMGKYEAAEFAGPMMQCLTARLVVFSGIKTDKLDDLEAMIDRGHIRLVIGAGVLGMALKKADVELAGKKYSLGAAENPQFKDAPFYVKPEYVETAKRIIGVGKKKGIEFALPVDVVLENGDAAETLNADQAQFDVGPKSLELYERKIAEFIDKEKPKTARPPIVAFYNGVFGKFEEERFAAGTKRFVKQLGVLEDAGVRVYVGGGEGGKAVEDYLGADKITHNFTAGGTVLNALGSQPVPYLIALRMAVQQAGVP